MGWSVMKIWEHDIEKNEEKVAEKIIKFLCIDNREIRGKPKRDTS